MLNIHWALRGPLGSYCREFLEPTLIYVGSCWGQWGFLGGSTLRDNRHLSVRTSWIHLEAMVGHLGFISGAMPDHVGAAVGHFRGAPIFDNKDLIVQAACGGVGARWVHHLAPCWTMLGHIWVMCPILGNKDLIC
jgi:hypothetical protein